MTDKQTGQRSKTTDSIKRNYLLILNAVGMAFVLIVVIWAIRYPGMTYVYTLMIYSGLFVITTINVIITSKIAMETMEQAKASAEMAKEMQNQRYDTFRPVIDIEDVRPGPPTNRVSKQQTTDEEKISGNFFECVLRNYGAGAAIDVYSPRRYSSVEPDSWCIGNIQAKEYKEMVTSESGPAFLKANKIGKQWFLVAYYRDVYGRCFESKRSVNIEDELFNIGSLQHRELDKQKDSELINEIWPPSDTGGNTND